VLGRAALDDPAPLRRDAIFRIASLTKPIAAAGAMLLVDDGALTLSEPVDVLLPELAGRRVLRSLESALDDTVAAARPITLEHLLTFRLGFGAVIAPPGTYPIQVAEAELDMKTLGPPWPPPPFGSDEWIARFVTLPLLHQPGDGWRYNTGAHVLGILLERASGQPLEVGHGQCGGHARLDARRYWAFVSMILANGKHEGQPLLSPASVEAMTRNHLTEAQRASAPIFLGTHGGWGYGMAAPGPTRAEPPEPSGFGWNGGTGTLWTTDPDY
jgi:CubicO group peptidase (beta-lactamase class C family)